MSHGDEGSGMIATILKWTFALIVIALILLWIVTGGPVKIWHAAKNFSFFGSSGTSTPKKSAGFLLPWESPNGPDDGGISQLVAESGGTTQNQTESTAQQLSDAEQQYGDLQTQIQQAKEFGTPSPSRGSVRINGSGGPTSSGPAEFIELDAASGNTAPIDITGWSLQSVVTGVRLYIPRGTSSFFMGAVNAQDDIYLNPGAGAIVSSGVSPVGTSFRENMCTGYLGQLQEFTPQLSTNCPDPSESLPLTSDNIRIYGDSCFDFVRSLAPCETPLQMPNTISPACQAFSASMFSYNGCATANRYKSDFPEDSWRIYLGANAELWRNSHDVIRLLDRESRTVDAISY